MASFRLFKNLGHFLVGLFACLLLSFVLILLLPILLWRWIVCSIIVPRHQPEIEKIVSLNSLIFAIDFIKNVPEFPPRCTLVTSIIVEGTVSKENLMGWVAERWINARDKETGNLLYPELQLFVEEWMGFMFWKQDKNFQLENHIYQYEIDEAVTPMESRKYVDNLVEALVNKPFCSKRSPWDLHVVQNYRNPELLAKTSEKTMTAIVFRHHHVIADGQSITSLILEGLFLTPLSLCGIPQSPTKTLKKNTISDIVQFPFRAIRDLGHAATLSVKPSTPWHCPDSRKLWKQSYRRFPMIPIEKIKFIKRKLGCSFSGVLLSGISAGASHSFAGRDNTVSLKKLPFGIAVPLPGLGYKTELRNDATGLLIELPIDNTLDPLERLKRTEDELRDAKHSKLPFIVPYLQKLSSIPFARLVRLLFTNRSLSSGISSLPGPSATIMCEERRKGLTTYFTSGAHNGVAGVGFTCLSFGDHIYINMTAETAVMNDAQLDEFMKRVCGEIETLHGIALSHNRD